MNSFSSATHVNYGKDGWDAFRPLSRPIRRLEPGREPVLVVGFAHPQTAIVLEGRLRAFVHAGFRVVVISSSGELLDRLQLQEGVETIAVPIKRTIAPLHDFQSLVRLCLVLWRLRPDVTEFSTPKAGLLGNIAALLFRVPQRIYLLRGLRLETATGLKRLILWACERAAAACSHAVLCNSRSLLEQANALGIASQTKLHLLGHGSGKGVDVERFRPATHGSSDVKSTAPVIGYVGRLTRDKGIPELIDAFDSLRISYPSVRLHLVGWFDESDDAVAPGLRRYIDTHPAIVRTGFVTDTAPYYRNFQMLVLPTWREGFPNVALEAAASGIPVITTSATGARDAVLDGETGIHVPCGDSRVLLNAMRQLVSDPVRARRMGEAGRRWVLKNFVDRDVQSLAVSFYRHLYNEASHCGTEISSTDEAAPAD